MSVSKGLINKESLSVAGDGTPVVTSHRIRSHRICDCAEKGISDCNCDRYFSQPDCDIGWDSSRDCWYHGDALYMLAASDSDSDLPVFPLLNPASKHDSHGFLETFFRMKSFLPDFHVTCYDSKYGRTVHLGMKDNPRLINIPPRDSDAWDLPMNLPEKVNFRNGIILRLLYTFFGIATVMSIFIPFG